MNREYFIIGLLLAIAFSLWLTKSLLEQSLYTNSLNLDKTEQLINSYRHENNSLKLEYLNDTSYRQIEEKAKKEGYIHATFLYLQSSTTFSY